MSYHRLINREHRLPKGYRPKDLTEARILFAPDAKGEKRLLRCEAAWHLERLFEQAKAEGIIFAGVSAFRSYERQEEIYCASVRERGQEHADRYIAKPGASEHQSGLAIDLSCETLEYELEETFADTPEGIWLKNNASLYGYVIRYPRGKEHLTGYQYEPWHIRYVTKALAYYLTKLGLTLEEYYAAGFCSVNSRF